MWVNYVFGKPYKANDRLFFKMSLVLDKVVVMCGYFSLN